ncbi:MAG: hypothetical protein VB878_03250 [Pirellulaceae bacterium]
MASQLRCLTLAFLSILPLAGLPLTGFCQDERVSNSRITWTRNASTGGAAGSAVSQPPQFLPNSAGQIWRQYDLSSYTSQVHEIEKPEQAVIDWILRETGTDLWFNEPLGILSAGSEKLLVYHTPEVQQRVANIVEQIVASDATPYVLQLRLISVGNPNWRARALKIMKPIAVQSTGVDAWLVSKEDAAMLVEKLRNRMDFTDHGSPSLVIPNGQSVTLTKRQPRSYVRSVQFHKATWPGYQLVSGQINEGYSLELSPLISSSDDLIDAVIRCEIDQVERFRTVSADIQPLHGPPQRIRLDVPQLVSWRLHERFRWPTDKVLILTCGVVATPQASGKSLSETLQLPNPLARTAARADALLMVECKGKASQVLLSGTRSANSTRVDYRGRY